MDILIELTHYSGYATIEEKLREKGFASDVESGIICRFKIQGITVDEMPTSEDTSLETSGNLLAPNESSPLYN